MKGVPSNIPKKLESNSNAKIKLMTQVNKLYEWLPAVGRTEHDVDTSRTGDRNKNCLKAIAETKYLFLRLWGKKWIFCYNFEMKVDEEYQLESQSLPAICKLAFIEEWVSCGFFYCHDFSGWHDLFGNHFELITLIVVAVSGHLYITAQTGVGRIWNQIRSLPPVKNKFLVNQSLALT